MAVRCLAFTIAFAILGHQSAAAQTVPAERPTALSTAPNPGTQPETPLGNSRIPKAPTGSMVGSATIAGPTGAVRLLSVSALKNMGLVTAGGGKIGDVAGVMERADGQQVVVVARGGLLGIGAREFSVPLENLVIQNGRLALRNMEPAQLDAMPVILGEQNSYRKLEEDRQVAVPMQP